MSLRDLRIAEVVERLVVEYGKVEAYRIRLKRWFNESND